MKFKMVYTKLIYILVSALLCLALASAVVNILIIAEAGRFVNASPAVTIVSLVSSILLLAAALCVLFNSHYIFADKELTVLFGCIWYSIPYADIFEVKEHSVTKELFVLYREPKSNIPDKTSAVQIIIKPELNQGFCDKMKDKSDTILFTVYNPADKD